jgi:pimeloyl-ACP methyl ester carboxylesterase
MESHLTASQGEAMPGNFVMVPGAGGAAYYWHRVKAELATRGHAAVAVDLPGDDDSAGLSTYADIVTAEIEDPANTVLVAQSMGGFTAPLVCARVRVRMLILLNAMIPDPGETVGEWGANTDAQEARVAAAKAGGYSVEFDVNDYFLHDLPAAERAGLEAHYRDESNAAFAERCQFERWPNVPTRVLVAQGDRLFPPEFQRRVARDRLGKDVEFVPGGHLAALSHPRELVERLTSVVDGETGEPGRGLLLDP